MRVFALCLCLATVAWARFRFLPELFAERPAASNCKPMYEPYPIEFPRDFGRHPDKEIEMWWFLSHLTDIASSRRFGLEVGVIRADLTRMCSNENQVVYSHSLAVSDVAADEYRFTLDYAIGAQIKASAPAERTFFLTAPGLFHFEQTGNVFTVWSTGQDKSQGHEGEVMYFNATLKDILGPLPMAQGGFAHATDDPALVAHADQLKMEGQGVLRMGNNEYFVRVEGFVQHLWHSDFKIPPKPGGWDWRYAQLSNGWAVDGTQWREADGSYNKHSYFNLIQPQPDGTSKNIYLSADKWTMTHGRPWTSPKTNTTYYTEFTVVFHTVDLVLTWRSLILDNELPEKPVYYEGAADVVGTLKGQPITGKGFIEGAGYCVTC